LGWPGAVEYLCEAPGSKLDQTQTQSFPSIFSTW
jgi:hypothetical protein